eukprot:CAMPEP_0175214236 /NCGR_PEP_ID=MMETSP0093-20121207/16600_1 /TAXON_ID=311494 /ORGANISM="Alexandrium monilatum, Strain CCMP3105" /LENGTH=91 /DNA_ID=CAMNT_0016507577 /DNA_START=291 /DNA_END=566 /DNA_ORIENTATION=-
MCPHLQPAKGSSASSSLWALEDRLCSMDCAGCAAQAVSFMPMFTSHDGFSGIPAQISTGSTQRAIARDFPLIAMALILQGPAEAGAGNGAK